MTNKYHYLSWLDNTHRPAMVRYLLFIALMTLVAVVTCLLPLTQIHGLAAYLPLHILLESSSIVVAILLFTIGWHANKRGVAANIVIVSCAFLGVAMLDFSHTLSFSGMPDFITPSGPEKAINFWLAARLLAALTLLYVVSTSWRRIELPFSRYGLLSAVLAVVLFIHWLVLFHDELLPHTFVPGQGLTDFKIHFEYVIIAINITALLLLLYRMQKRQLFNAAALFGAVAMMALSEYLFTLYSQVSDIYNLLGHVYKIISYWFLYRAFFQETIESPFVQLRESENLLHNIVENIPHMIFLKDADNLRFTMFNRAGEEILGLTRTELLGRNDYDFFPGDQADLFVQKDREVLQQSEVIDIPQEPIDTPRGTRILHTKKIRLNDAKGQASYLLGISEDITQRKREEERIISQSRMLDLIFANSQDCLVLLDKKYNYLRVNHRFAEACGLAVAELKKLNHFGLYPSPLKSEFDQAVELGVPFRHFAHPFIFSGHHSQETTYWDIDLVPINDPETEVEILLFTLKDVTRQKYAELALIESERSLKESQNIAGLGGFSYNLATGMWRGSETLYQLFGINPQYEYTMRDWLQLVHESDRNGLESYLNDKVLAKRYPLNREYRLTIPNSNKEYWVYALGRLEYNDYGVPTLLRGTIQDITKRKQNELRIDKLAHFDQLTGLPNRTMLLDRFTYALNIAHRSNQSLAVVFLDLDHFKNVNDTLGHTVGDELLMKTARQLKASLRAEDTVSRMGGDEFVLLLLNTDAAGAAHVANKVLKAIAKPHIIGRNVLTTTASLGISLYPEDGEALETLSKNADTAMYRAKKEGRNTFRFFTTAMQSNSARMLQLSNGLHFALLNEELEVFYQPQVSSLDGRVVAAEALLRWHHPELGLISPAEFIPLAEDNGLILPIGEWVLQTAARQLKTWLDQGMRPILMAVNISSVQFHQLNIIERVLKILDEVQLPYNLLELELTEAVAMDDPETAIKTMNDLHDKGIRMSIDDFGTGYSSLSYLKKFKVYKLKVDQSFIRDLMFDAEDRAIVTSIIHMAAGLGLKSIAEGVEDEEQLEFLKKQHCDEIQGYYFSKPLNAKDFAQYLTEN